MYKIIENSKLRSKDTTQRHRELKGKLCKSQWIQNTGMLIL